MKYMVYNIIYGIDNVLSVIHALTSRFSRECKIKCYKNHLKIYINRDIIIVDIHSKYKDFNKYQKMYKLLYRI